MAQNKCIFLPPNSLDSPTRYASILNTAESTSIYIAIIGDFTWSMPDCEELVGVTHRRR